MSPAVGWVRHCNHAVREESCHSLESVHLPITIKKIALVQTVAYSHISLSSLTRTCSQSTIYHVHIAPIWAAVFVVQSCKLTKVWHPRFQQDQFLVFEVQIFNTSMMHFYKSVQRLYSQESQKCIPVHRMMNPERTRDTKPPS